MRGYRLSVFAATFFTLGMVATARGEHINIAVGGGATQSTNYDAGNTYPASNGVDGDYATHQDTGYSSSVTSQYWQVDLGQEKSIDSVWTHYRDQGSSGATLRKRAYSLTCTIYNASNVAVYTSPVFNPEASPLADPGFGPWKLDLGTTVVGQKVRITKQCGSQTSYNRCLHCNEIEVREENGRDNVARGATVTTTTPYYSNANYNCKPTNLTDGTLGTYCHSTNATITSYAYLIDMGKSSALGEIDVWGRQEANFVKGGAYAHRLGYYRISLHDDNGSGGIGAENWYAVLNDQCAGYYSGLGVADVFEASDGTGSFHGQWIKIEGLSQLFTNCGANGCALQISEIQAYAVPEPSALALLVGGVVGMLVWRRSL